MTAPPATGVTRALVGGELVDVRSGHGVADQTILIADGRIRAVGPRASVAVPPGAETHDVSGAYVIPGLIDMHAHVAQHASLLPVYLAHGVTTVRDTGGPLTPLRLLRIELDEGRRLGPRLFFAGPLLDGIPPLWPPHTVLVDTEERAEAAVRFLVTQGVDLIKVYNSVPERSLEVIVRTAHALDLRVTGHVPRAITMTRAIEIGMDCLEHIRVTGREMLPAADADRIDFLPVRRREALLWERYDPDSAPFGRLADLLAAKGVFLDPTFAVDVSPLREDAEARRAAQETAGLPGWIAEALKGERPDFMRVAPELLELSRAGVRKRQRFVKRCAEAGVRIIAGTDVTGPGDDLPGRGLQVELAHLAAAGLSPIDALRAATLTAADALGRASELGAIEEGKLADLVVVEGDPLADVGAVRRVRAVVHRGRWSTPAQLLERPGAREDDATLAALGQRLS